MSKVIVTFEKNWRGYAAGETAGFDSATAEGLVDAGYAIEADKQALKKAKPGASVSAPAAKKPEGDTGTKPDDQADEGGKP